MTSFSGAVAIAATLIALGACERPLNTANETAAAEGPAPAIRHFVNSPEHARSQWLRDHYVDFSFDYPGDWLLSPDNSGYARDFVHVFAPHVRGRTPFNFRVAPIDLTGDPSVDRPRLDREIAQSTRYSEAVYDYYRVLQTGPQRVGHYESYGYRFEAVRGSRSRYPSRLYGRLDVILAPGATRGAVLITTATDGSEEVRSGWDVGEKGKLRALLASFRLNEPGTQR